MSPENATTPTGAPSPGSPPRAGRLKVRRSIARDALNVPNLLTMARVAVIPLFLYFLDRATPTDSIWAAWIFAGAAFTDMLDGWLARKLGVVSVLGKLLDPLADKLIVMASLVWMVALGRIGAWVVVLLLSREFAVTGLRGVAASEGVVISAGQDGKTKTALQMIGIISLIVGYPYRMVYGPLDIGLVDFAVVGRGLVYLSLVFSLASAAQYTHLFAQAVDGAGRRRDDDEPAAKAAPPA